MVGFLREEKLCLLPFYDLYHLKKRLEDRYTTHLSKMKEKAEKTFKRVIREIDLEIDKMLN